MSPWRQACLLYSVRKLARTNSRDFAEMAHEMVNLDLNLLRVFDVLFEERHATRTASRLGMTQSAVSHALNRLRFILKDELFIRSAGGLRPTPRAVEISTGVHTALMQLQMTLGPAEFEPSVTARKFTALMSSYGCHVLLPPLVRRMREEAPLVQLEVLEPGEGLLEQLDAWTADFLIGVAVAWPERLSCEILVDETLAWTVRADHPLAKLQKVDSAALFSYPHVVISRWPRSRTVDPDVYRGFVASFTWEDGGVVESALADRHLSLKMSVTVPTTIAALGVTAQTDMVALVPRRAAEDGAYRTQLKILDVPEINPRTELQLLFVKERLGEPGIAWMRDLIRSVAADL